MEVAGSGVALVCPYSTITTGDAGCLSLCTCLLQLHFLFLTQSVLYQFAGIASARSLQDIIDLVSFNTLYYLNELGC